MSDWGVPDWRFPAAYQAGAKWSRDRWRWEFLRRRDDLRAEFAAKAEVTYQDRLALFRRIPQASPGGRVIGPHEPGFFVPTRAIGGVLQKLPNPRIGDQPAHVIAWVDRPNASQQFQSENPPAGFSRFDFDLSKPIPPQLATAEQLLRESQRQESGKILQRRERPEKWAGYLQAIDARAENASWAQIAAALPQALGSQQAARDAWQQARALCFNF